MFSFKPTLIFFLGPAGSGKSTQCFNLAMTSSLEHVPVGALLREELAHPTSNMTSNERQNFVLAMANPTKFVDGATICSLVHHAIQNLDPSAKFVIIDGFPTNYDCYAYWDTHYAQSYQTNPLFIHFQISEQESINRCVQRGRPLEVTTFVQGRWNAYANLTEPLLKYLTESHTILTVDAARTEYLIYRDLRGLIRSVHHDAFPLCSLHTDKPTCCETEPIRREYCQIEYPICNCSGITTKRWRFKTARIESFHGTNWLGTAENSPSIDALAAAGFFYLGAKDYVRCFECQGTLGEWTVNDDALAEHLRHFPWCNYANNQTANKTPKSSQPVLYYKLLSPNATPPTRGSTKAAGIDLYSAITTAIPAGGRGLIPTDLALLFPPGTYGHIATRSGMAITKFVSVGGGVIDADYRGNVKIILFNFADTPLEIQRGMRVAQVICEKLANPTIRALQTNDMELLETSSKEDPINIEPGDGLRKRVRGGKGFGSSGD